MSSSLEAIRTAVSVYFQIWPPSIRCCWSAMSNSGASVPDLAGSIGGAGFTHSGAGAYTGLSPARATLAADITPADSKQPKYHAFP